MRTSLYVTVSVFVCAPAEVELVRQSTEAGKSSARSSFFFNLCN